MRDRILTFGKPAKCTYFHIIVGKGVGWISQCADEGILTHYVFRQQTYYDDPPEPMTAGELQQVVCKLNELNASIPKP